MSTNHATPPPGWDTFNARKQAENQQPSHDDNQPESRDLTREEEQIFDNARHAVGELRKTFETWTVIARGVEAADKRADRNPGKRAFMRVLEQQGLYSALGEKDSSVKSTASRLLKILDNLPEIEAWRASRSDYERIHWASPTAIEKHFFQEREREAKRRDGAEEQEKPPSPAQRIKTLEADLAHAQDELASTVARYESGAPLQPEPMFRDADEPVPAKPRKVSNGFAGVLAAWKAIREALIREALQDEQPLTLGQLDEFWDVITHDRAELISLFPQAPAPAPKRKRKTKKAAPEPATETPPVEPAGTSPDPSSSAPAQSPAPEQAPSVEPTPAAMSSMIASAPAKPTNVPERRLAAIARAHALGDHAYADEIEKCENYYVKELPKWEAELDRREAELV